MCAGAIGKAVSTSASIALTVILEHALVLRKMPDLLSAVLCAGVLNATLMYSTYNLSLPSPQTLAADAAGMAKAIRAVHGVDAPPRGHARVPADDDDVAHESYGLRAHASPTTSAVGLRSA